jgi:hypothetical protein
MPEWAIVLLSAVAGSVLTMLIRGVIEWWRRPRLKIDFEEVGGQKPYILDLSWESDDAVPVGKTPRVKFIRLNVQNAGRKPALDCEAKLVIFECGKREPVVPIIHWSRRDYKVYKTLDQQYAPIHLNRSDDETLELLMLRYYAEETELLPGVVIMSRSHRIHSFRRNVTYLIQVTVYASNAVSNPFSLELRWDGTLDGFNKAVRKVEKSKYVQN